MPSMSSAPGTAGLQQWPTRTSRGPTASCTHISAETKPAWPSCSANSVSPAASLRMWRPRSPGSLHEGGELGYALSHAFGAAFDNPDLLCLLHRGRRGGGDRPAGDGLARQQVPEPGSQTVPCCPILHLNGYKIANPTVLARIGDDELTALLEGYGYEVNWVSGEDPAEMHQLMAATLDKVVERVSSIQRSARESGNAARPRWPMIVFRSLKGWTGPKIVDGLPIEGTWRSHQVPLAEVRTNPGHLALLESWMSSYRPEELFDEQGTLIAELAGLPPKSHRRMSANPHSNGGLLLQELDLPDFRDYGVPVEKPGTTLAEATRVLGGFLRDVIQQNPSNFRLFGPDEVAVQPLAGGLRSHGPAMGRRGTRHRRPPSARRAGSWRCFPSTSAKDGWRVTC